jgi:phosphate transport system permease protein
MVWLSAGAAVLAVAVLLLLLSLLLSRGMAQFWPRPVVLLELAGGSAQLGEVVREESSAGRRGPARAAEGDRAILFYRGTSDRLRRSLSWINAEDVVARSRPAAALRIRRFSEEPLFAFPHAFLPSMDAEASAAMAPLDWIQEVRGALPAGDEGHALQLRLASGELLTLPLSEVRDLEAPNAYSVAEKLGYFFRSVAEFVSASPRQFNAEGGVFPAIVGTVVLVVLMSVLVTPLGILAAVYLQEYAQRGVLTRVVRIAVNNLAGVPSIVYGVFGLGFFVYGIGGSLDRLLFAETLPAPTLGTPGLLWASLTMALLTLPVVIVAAEEGLARVPQSLREGSLALGATRAETLWRVVLPAASPALLTGLILAVARATGEVAPLILVGVAKYAPVLPVSGDFPFVHLDRQFMHLGFHIFDLGFQNPRLELTIDRVFATALLLVLIVLLLNLSAVILRSRLREAFKTQDLR